MRVKVLLSLAATVIVLISVMQFVTRRTFDPRFANLEMTRVPHVTAQVKDALDDRCKQLSSELRDWSHWNDAEAFLKGQMPDFTRQSFSSTTIDEMQISILVYADLDGQPRLTLTSDAMNDKPDVTDLLLAVLKPDGRLNEAKSTPMKGLIREGASLFEFAAGPVTSADGKNPSSGICLFAREIDSKEVSVLQANCKHQVQILSVGDEAGRTLLNKCLAADTRVYANADNDQQLSAYAPLADRWGNPVALSRSIIDRELYAEGRQTIVLITSELIAMGVLLAGLTFMLFETLVLSRISQFSSQLHRLASTADLSMRVSLNGNDEMSNLVKPVNKLLCSLQTAQNSLAEQQKQLVTSERRLSTALTATGDGLWDWSKAQGVYLSPGWFLMLGLPVETNLFDPQKTLQLLCEEDRHQLTAAMAPVLDGSTDLLSVEVRLPTSSGEIKWVQVRGQVIERDTQHQPVRIVGLAQDISERRASEMAVLESRELFRNAFEESATGMAMVSVEGKLLRVNPLFCEIVGYTAEELSGRTFQDITHPEDIAGDETLFRSILCGDRRHYTMEKRYINKEGAIVWVLLNVGVVLGAEKKPAYFISQVQDITQQRRSQQELHAYAQRLLLTKDELERRSIELADKTIEAEMAKRAAEEASGAKSAFLAHMSHEIRTPMTGILGFADILRQPEVADIDRKHYAETIVRHGQHLLALIDDTLDISKIEAGKMTLELIDCDPLQILTEVQSMLGVRAKNKGITFNTDAAADVPRKIRTDPTRLRQILLNVIGNAIKFSSGGEVRVDVAYLNSSCEAPRVRFIISDTGIGMTSEQIERIFQPFEQADVSTARRFGGTGLGLAISKRLVELLDGNITVHSEPGVGTQFCITLGVGRRATPLEPTQLPPAPPSASLSEISLAGRRILIADDGRDNQYLLHFYLKKASATSEAADNGRSAVEQVTAAAARGEPFDLVLMDIQMPEMDGYTATTALRAAGYKLPILALTAHGKSKAREESLAAGCSDHLVKPIAYESLIQSIAFWTNQPTGVPQLHSAWENEEAFKPVLQDYVAELPLHVTKLLEQIQNHDLDALRTTVHQIRGAGGGYGFADLSTVAGRIEDLINEKHLDSIADNVDKLVKAIRSVHGYDPILETPYAPARAHYR